MSAVTTLFGTIPAVIGGPEATIEGTAAGEWILGTDNDNVINGLAGDDFVQALAGNDRTDAGDGNDTVLGGDGDDDVEGNIGNDVLRGDAGADTFTFDPSREEGADTIADFAAQDGDVIAISAAGLGESGASLEGLSGAALDESADFDIVENADGDVEIQHLGGTITLNGVAFSDELSFAALEESGQLEFTGFVQGSDDGEELTGSDDDDLIDALGGDDTITPLGGDDVVTTGEGRDTVNVDPSNASEGADVITDFSVPSELDPTAGDSINFALADLLEADPDLPSADGDATSLSLGDFDASENWDLGGSEDGNVLLTHPGGSVEITNIQFSDQTFADLGPVIRVDGQEFQEPIPVDSSEGGGEVSDGGSEGGSEGGEDVADEGEDAAGGEEPVTEPPVVDDDAIA
jgi:Ca2+-binding RTX toxin-like protein